MITSKTVSATKSPYTKMTGIPGVGGRNSKFIAQLAGQARLVRKHLKGVGIGLAVLALWGGALQAGNIYIPNFSFESPVVPPVTPFAGPAMDDWAKSPQPFWYDPAQNFDTPWDFLMGEFYNVPNPSTFIDNCDGSQAAFLFALPEAALFQDYNSLSGTNTTPSHALNATYTVGRVYNLTVGLMGGGGGMKTGVTFRVSLYYRDAASNMVTVAATTITNTLANFPTNTHLVDFQVQVPGVKATDPWAGQHIGIQLLSTADFGNSGGYWDIDNVRLIESVYIPNFSFESPVVPPVTPFAGPAMDDWAKSPQPFWYDPAQNFDTPWDFLMGEFYNVPNPSTFIDNCDGSQAAFLFALPEAALFQDYNSLSGTNTTPSHALNATYTVGRVYNLTVGLMGGGGGMKTGVTFRVSLYYRDAASNMVTVAATTITNTLANFPTNTHLVDFQVQVPGVKATDPWAGQHIGIQLLSTADFSNSGGYWDIDNVRLAEIVAPNLVNPVSTNGQFKFTLQSEPGRRFEILATTNVTLPASSWGSLGILTNVTGNIPFIDTTANLDQRLYLARQLP